MKIIISMVSCILFFSAAYAGTKLKQFEPLLNEFEMDLLQRRVDTLSEDKTIDQAVDFFALSCFGTDEQKTTGLYLGSVSRKQVESGGRFVIDNTPLRIYLEVTFPPSKRIDNLKMDYVLKSGNLYPVPLSKQERGTDVLTGQQVGPTYLHAGVPRPLFAVDDARLSADLTNLETRVDAVRFWVVAVLRRTPSNSATAGPAKKSPE